MTQQDIEAIRQVIREEMTAILRGVHQVTQDVDYVSPTKRRRISEIAAQDWVMLQEKRAKRLAAKAAKKAV